MSSQKNCEVTVYRSPEIFILRPEIFSLTLGIFWSLVVLVLTLAALGDGQHNGITAMLEAFWWGYELSFLGLLAGFLWAFLSGFLLGFMVGCVYRYFIRHWTFGKSAPLFTVSRCQNVNVIQEGIGEEPFTIVFVANPYILPLEVPTTVYEDAIIQNHDLFLKTVNRCIRSFLENKLLRQPDIFQQLRLITIFDHANDEKTLNAEDLALCEGVSRDANILAARQPDRDDANNVTQNHVFKYVKDELRQKGLVDPEMVDMIVVISGDETYTRSTARLCEDNKDGGGKPFTFTFFEPGTPAVQKWHHYYTKEPGMFALSATDDRLKTPIHEFAHAISDIENGVVDDEYLDITHAALEYRINKKFRGGFMISQWMLTAAADPENGINAEDWSLLEPLLNKDGIKCIEFPTQHEFHIHLRDAISNDDLYLRNRLILIKLSRFRTVFRIDPTALNNLTNFGVDPDVVKQLRDNLGEINRDFTDKGEFVRTVKRILVAGNMADQFDTYILLILRFANVHNFPIPREFARYTFAGSEKVYDSDRRRSDKEMSWVSYSPARVENGSSCLMDTTYHHYHFDGLIYDFIYDRLMTKISRNHQNSRPC